MSPHDDRWDAEDIASGTPLSGPDMLAQRIEDGLDGAWAGGEEEGCEAGYEEALNDLIAELELDGDCIAVTYDDRDKVLKWIKSKVQPKALQEK